MKTEEKNNKSGVIMRIVIFLVTLLFLIGCDQQNKKPLLVKQPFELRSFEQSFGYTQAIKVGDRIYISGSVSMDDEGKTLGVGDMRTQIFNAYEDIRKSLEFYGADFSNIVKETVYTTDMEALLKAADERAKFYKGLRFPVSSWIGVQQLVSPEFLIEVEVEAIILQ
jgi:2-iminobutanoate/2-iminopropanoate deaminase